jgi:cytochrome c oxidase subunit 2
MLRSFQNINDAVSFTFFFILVISVLLLILITFLMVFFVIRYHRKRHPKAQQVASHALLEITWTVVPTILVLVMFYYGWVGYKMMRNVPENALQVTATARMWSWQYSYENGKQSDKLYVPAGRPVKVNLESLDVIHSFYAPAYMVKQDVVPGLDTYVWFNPVDTGSFDVFCAEYCGQRHSYMLSKIVVIPEAEFNEWIEKDVAVKAAIQKEGVSEEERVAGLRRLGEQLTKIKGCMACHSTDGSALVGPSFKKLFGKTENVVTDGKTRRIVVDAPYIRKSILEPMADITEGYQPLMPPQVLTEDEIDAVVEYLKSLK